MSGCGGRGGAWSARANNGVNRSAPAGAVSVTDWTRSARKPSLCETVAAFIEQQSDPAHGPRQSCDVLDETWVRAAIWVPAECPASCACPAWCAGDAASCARSVSGDSVGGSSFDRSDNGASDMDACAGGDATEPCPDIADIPTHACASVGASGPRSITTVRAAAIH